MLTRNLCILVGILVAVSGAPAALGEELTLVENGTARATLVLGREPSDQARHAAEVLQHYIERISGARLPIHETAAGPRVLVGRSGAAEIADLELPGGYSPAMNEEGYVVKSIGQDLVLAGNEDWQYKGTLFAVYDLLHELGCRWYFPGEYGEVLPALRTVRIAPVDRTERPSFRIRHLWYSGWMPIGDGDRAEYEEWYERNRLNALSVSLPGDGSVSRLAPPDGYFESHPHLFAVNQDGDRVREMMCMSEPEGVRIGAETIKAYFRANPDQYSFGFAPPDGFPTCYCERCQSYFPGFMGKGYGDPSLSEVWFQFANAIAEEVYKEFPDRWVLTNGYANRVRLPERIPVLSPNLGIQSAIIAACTLHRTGDPRCWQRLHYEEILNRWTETVPIVLIYDYDPGKAVDNLPFPNLHNLKHDMPYFHRRGVWGFYTEGVNSWMVTHMNYYVRARQMWNVEEDVDALVRDYCERFYGPAARPVEEYIWTLEDAVDRTHLHSTWGRLIYWRFILGPVEQRLEAQISEAEARVPSGDGALAERVRALRLTHGHMMAYLAMERAVADGAFEEGVQFVDEMLEIRNEIAEIKPNLVPHTPDWVQTFRSSIEWHRSIYEQLAAKAGGAEGELVQLLPREWEFKKDPEDIGTIYQWYLPGRVHGWEPIDTTVYWEAQGHQDEKGWGYAGHAWYRTSFNLTESQADLPLRLTIGAAYNAGVWIWVNGVMQDASLDRHWRLGHHDVRTPIHLDISDAARPGVNDVAVLVYTGPPGRNPRGGIHRRSFVWAARNGGAGPDQGTQTTTEDPIP